MNTTTLNMTTLDGGIIIKRGEGGGSTPSPDTPSAKPKWTGHADAEGLKAIGWDDADIAYYQENGVNWNEEDDEWHKVTDDNKALYGVLTASNISSYKDRIVYLPKIDTSGVTSMASMFADCKSLISIPMLDTSNVVSMRSMFYNCYFLTVIPMFDTGKVTDMAKMFYNCYSLTAIPQLDTSEVTNMPQLFYKCYSLTTISLLGTRNSVNVNQLFYRCYSLTAILHLDTSNMVNIGYVFDECYTLTHAKLKNVKSSHDLTSSDLLSKGSLLYIINNEAATSAITIKLASYAYDRWAADPDIVAALANHPNISISK